MIIKVLAKVDLTGKDLQIKLTSLYQQEKFKKIVKEMQAKEMFKVEELEVEKAYTFEAAVGQKAKGLIQFNSTIINLVNKDKTVTILFNELPIHQDHYFGQVLQKGDSNNIVTFTFEQEEVIEKQYETNLVQFEFAEENISIDNEVSLLAWWTSDGCLPGGYQHCGGNCGYGSTHGGGKPINATDTCCVSHDRCYDVFGYGDNCCDKELVSCVSGHTTVAAAGIRAFFGPQALLC
ncbi:hypothetical protein [Lysinibacillus agricola]|uniref:hypothetical protein n=1 Tax=Lysinibacillus agricola TaxID=2590012 RepID=UPI003C2A8B64